MENSPELRFSEFSNQWIHTIFGNFTKINQGLQIPIADRYLEKIEGSHFYITNEFLRKNSNKSYFILNPTESVICSQDDVLMTRTGNTGQVVTGVNGAFHNNFFKIKFDTSKYNKNFIVYFLRLRHTQNLISRLAGTSTIPDLNHGDFYKIPFQTPNFKEQQKIADFLSSVDKKISLLTEKQSLLQRYKKGVMQKLFSQELRFKDDQGNDFPDWEEKKFKDLGKFSGGGTPSTDKSEYWDGKVPWISSSDITENHIDKVSITRFINEKAIKESATKLIPANSILLVSRVGVGKLAISLKEVCTSQDFTNFTPQEDDVHYLAYYILYKKNILIRFSQGTSIKGFTTKDIGLMKIQIPQIEEQQKIANFLSEIDKKINYVTQQIEQIKYFKKGLLQQMFV